MCNILAEIFQPQWCFTITLTRVDMTSASETFVSPNLCTLNEAIFISDKRGANRDIKNEKTIQYCCKYT